jgi:predicted transposase YbfD/YdcC
MSEGIGAGIGEYFAELDDPRVDRTKLHRLEDIILVVICAVVSGAETWNDIEEWGRMKADWLHTFMELPNGIPSHDTFARVFGLLDPGQFEQCFVNWVRAAYTVSGGQVVAMDGKTVRRSHDRHNGKAAIHMVSAWATESRIVLAQTKVDDKSNEITAIPDLLSVLDLSGCIVTLDAMGCQTEIAQQIQDRQADYVLTVKQNQEHLYADIKELFDIEFEQPTPFEGVKHDHAQTINKDHGRIEIRDCWTISDPEFVSYLRGKNNWAGLQSIAMVTAERRVGDATTTETRYYISSLPGDARLMLHSVRAHWSIENSVHWVLDVAFREDDCRKRQGNSAHNFAIVRHIALNLIQQERSTKRGVKGKRLKAAWSDEYRANLISRLLN